MTRQTTLNPKTTPPEINTIIDQDSVRKVNIMVKEFKEFALKGNVIDLAVGVIIGTAFGKIVTSLVEDIIMPPIGRLVGNLDFSNYFIALNGESYASLLDAQSAGAPTLNYGLFLTNVINFLIVAFVLFIFIRQINQIKRSPAPEVNTKECPYCQTKISNKATRCPACTSLLENTLPSQDKGSDENYGSNQRK